MTLKDLKIPTLEQLEKMSDDELRAHFAPFLEICKPKFKVEGKIKKKKVKLVLDSEPVKSERDALKDMAAKMGFGHLKL